VRSRIALALPAVVAVLAHWPATRHELLVWDDPAYVTQNPLLERVELREVLDPRLRILSAWTPTTVLSYALERELFGLDARAFHATNLALHGVNAALVAVLLSQLGLPPIGAAAGAALFAAHPLQVETVAWVSARKDLLAAALSIGSVLLYLRRRTTARAGALLLFLLALGAKGSTVVVPLLLATVHAIRRWRPCRAEWAVLAAMGVLAALRGALEVASQVEPAREVASLGAGPRLAAMVGVVSRYVRRWILPLDLTHAYATPSADLWTFGAGALLLALGWWAVRVARSPSLRLGLAWWIVAMLPVLNVLPAPYLEADRYQYMALAGPALWAGYGLERLARRAPAAARAVLGVAVLALGVQSWICHGDWASTEVFLARQLHRNPAWWPGRLALARWHLEAGRLDDAEREARALLARFPERAGPAYEALAAVARGRGDLALAAELGARAVDQGDLPSSWIALCLARAETGQTESGSLACDHAARAARHDPGLRRNLAQAYVALGNAADDRGEPERARPFYEKALALERNLPEAHYNLGVSLQRAERLEEADAHYAAALALRPDDVDALTNRANVLRRLGRARAARSLYDRAIALDPDRAEARYGLAVLLASAGDLERAEAELERVLSLRPDLEEAHRALAAVREALSPSRSRTNPP
jgi:tetratricopeptide (TPR) repeat protein